MPITRFYTLNKSRSPLLQRPGIDSIPAYSGRSRYGDAPAATAVSRKALISTGTEAVDSSIAAYRQAYRGELDLNAQVRE